MSHVPMIAQLGCSLTEINRLKKSENNFLKSGKNSNLFYSQRVEAVGCEDLVIVREVDGLMRALFVDNDNVQLPKHYEM